MIHRILSSVSALMSRTARALPEEDYADDAGTPLSEAEAAALFQEFDLPVCSDVTYFPDKACAGRRVESWLVGPTAECWAAWERRQNACALLSHLDDSNDELAAMTWICGTTVEKAAQCTSVRRHPQLLVTQPQNEDYLFFHRIFEEPQ